ncbi:hypothetical protein CB1_000850024 [Camelus ferus]|nr:hypothetical protein CB1_000850024 [Camelus ferus]
MSESVFAKQQTFRVAQFSAIRFKAAIQQAALCRSQEDGTPPEFHRLMAEQGVQKSPFISLLCEDSPEDCESSRIKGFEVPLGTLCSGYLL